jgi:hypothetical protein
MNIIGICLGTLSLLIFFFIKPSIEEEPKNNEETMPLTRNDRINSQESSPLDLAQMNELIVDRKPKSRFTEIKENPIFRRLLGIVMALTAGCLYGVNLVPFVLWRKDLKEHHKEPGPLDYAFSYTSGIWLANTAALLIYCLLKRNQPEIYPNMILPSIVSGAMWALASCGWMIATAYLGFTVGYVLVAIGPMLVNSFWTTVVFREIKGIKNIVILLFSLSIALAGVILLALSH